MSQTSPRIPPASPERLIDEQKALLGDWGALNFSGVIIEHPGLYRALIPLIAKLISGSDLPPRDREILVLRTLALCDETYEAAHHELIAEGAGLSAAEIAAARAGGEALAPADRLLAAAAEELVRDRVVSEATWKALAQRYAKVELMELVALVGGYTLMAMLTRSFGIELEDAQTFEGLRALRTYK